MPQACKMDFISFIVIALTLSAVEAYMTVRECPSSQEKTEKECMKLCMYNEFLMNIEGMNKAHLYSLARIFRGFEVTYDKETETMSWKRSVKASKDIAADNVTVTAHFRKQNMDTEKFDSVMWPVASCCGVPLSKGECRVPYRHPGELYHSIQMHDSRLGSLFSLYSIEYRRYHVICPPIKETDREISCLVVDTKTGETSQQLMYVELHSTNGNTNKQHEGEAKICAFSIPEAPAQTAQWRQLDDSLTKALEAAFGTKVIYASRYFNDTSAANCSSRVLRLGDNSTYPRSKKGSVECFRYDYEYTVENSAVFCFLPDQQTPGWKNYILPALITILSLIALLIVFAVCSRKKIARYLKQRKEINVKKQKVDQLDAEQSKKILSGQACTKEEVA